MLEHDAESGQTAHGVQFAYAAWSAAHAIVGYIANPSYNAKAEQHCTVLVVILVALLKTVIL